MLHVVGLGGGGNVVEDVSQLVSEDFMYLPHLYDCVKREFLQVK